MISPTFKFEAHYNEDVLPFVQKFVDEVYGIFTYGRNAHYEYADYIDNKGSDRIVSREDLCYHIKSVVYILLNSDKAYCEFDFKDFPFIVSFRRNREFDSNVECGGMWHKITDFNVRLNEQYQHYKPYIYYKK